MDKHSPTPWEWQLYNHNRIALRDANECDIISDFEGINDLFGGGESTKEEQEANADFICKAVNNHDRLVDRLRFLFDFVEVNYKFSGMPKGWGTSEQRTELVTLLKELEG